MSILSKSHAFLNGISFAEQQKLTATGRNNSRLNSVKEFFGSITGSQNQITSLLAKISASPKNTTLIKTLLLAVKQGLGPKATTKQAALYTKALIGNLALKRPEKAALVKELKKESGLTFLDQHARKIALASATALASGLTIYATAQTLSNSTIQQPTCSRHEELLMMLQEPTTKAHRFTASAVVAFIALTPIIIFVNAAKSSFNNNAIVPHSDS